MENQLTVVEFEKFQIGELLDLVKESHEFEKFARAENTRKAYASDWKDFFYWCQSRNLNPLPASPQTVRVYLTSRAKQEWVNYKGKTHPPLKVASLRRRLTAISQAHQLARQPFNKSHPDIQEVWKGIRNKLGTAQTHKEPILIEDLRKMMGALSNQEKKNKWLLEIRDKAILLLGFAGAFRRSELVSLSILDVNFLREGLIVSLRKSKTDQEGIGREIAIPYGSNILTCPVRALQDWLQASQINEGAIFRSINRHGQIRAKALTSHSVALIIKRNAHLADRKDLFSGHSLRAGFATTAAIAGVPEHVIMKQTGHKRSDTIKRYIRLGNRWTENAATKVGL